MPLSESGVGPSGARLKTGIWPISDQTPDLVPGLLLTFAFFSFLPRISLFVLLSSGMANMYDKI
jgi:hypothetical protein